MNCRSIANSDKFRLDSYQVKNYFADHGCELLEKYVKSNQLMKYKCKCGKISKIRWNAFRTGCRCKSCGYIKSSNTMRTNSVEVANYFESQGCHLTTEYIGARLPVGYICSCGRESQIRFSDFKRGGRCYKCKLDRFKGSTHPSWNPDREKVELRKKISKKCYGMLYKSLRSVGKKKTQKAHELLGYTVKELNDCIAKHPNWANVKDGSWQLDHIFPIKAFIDYNVYDIKIINALDNLQPLLDIDNQLKSDNYDKIEFENFLANKNVYFTRPTAICRRPLPPQIISN